MNSSTTPTEIVEGSHRVISIHQTYKRAISLMDSLGKWRIIDLTDYNSLSIHVYAIQSDDSAEWLGYGKGVTAIQSKVSALMEAIERHSIQQLPSNHICSSYNQLRDSHHILLPSTLIPGSNIDIDPKINLEWLPGVDLHLHTEVWIPAAYAVLSKDLAGPKLKKWRTSNGVASGNTIDEAICHSLYEMIERDAWTLAWLQAVTIPQVRYLAQQVRFNTTRVQGELDFLPQSELLPLIDHQSLPDTAKNLIHKFKKAGIDITIRDITSDIGVATFLAAGFDKYQVLFGMGTHLSTEIALIRAITECAQMFQVKKHLNISDEPTKANNELQAKLLFGAGPIRSFTEVQSYHLSNINEHITLLLDRLSCVGLDQVIAIDLTDPTLEIPVVRVLIPGIEDWAAYNFAPEFYYLGHRGQKFTP